jgi:cell division protein FtsB
MTLRAVWTAAALATVLAAMLLVSVFSEDGLLDLLRLRRSRDEMLQRNRAIVEENSGLLREIDRLKRDPRYIENVARQELGVIGKHEVILRFKISDERPE